ncbi:4116_t:CDS:10 [Diversispora eburnea]|uniref:tRNA (guanine(37)-N1)-methyltransferase n=1 Tax=Diversispora eburnea TaxID=1213867 RepID=A0A9N8YPE8_9GLOM|nr:4116_t:CDS:10 [Diversispora eburnea]
MILPPVQHGATVLNREFFRHLFNQPKLRNVVEDPESKSTKIILLNPKFNSLEVNELINKEGLDVIHHSIELNYDYWDEILKAILPEEVESPSSFTQVGHIAHMNLRDEFLPWKYIIGQVILDKNPKITTVVNKTDIIDSTYRCFNMEILGGENNLMAEVKESNCRFRFDFSQVYWNSRLNTEHERLIKMFKKGNYICDVFAGVGPFAIPAAKKGCIVYANDLNPASYKYLAENISLNKANDKIYPYNLDGRHFIKKAVQDLEITFNNSNEKNEKNVTVTVADSTCLETSTINFQTFDHFIMNLPATAIEFLDSFRGLYKGKESLFEASSMDLPMIHCHCFSKSETPEKELLEDSLSPESYKIHFVRQVAPNKNMFCFSFRLSRAVAFSQESCKRKQDEVDISSQIDNNKNNDKKDGKDNNNELLLLNQVPSTKKIKLKDEKNN